MVLGEGDYLAMPTGGAGADYSLGLRGGVLSEICSFRLSRLTDFGKREAGAPAVCCSGGLEFCGFGLCPG